MPKKPNDLKILTIAAIVAVALFATAAYANPQGADVCVIGAEVSAPPLVTL